MSMGGVRRKKGARSIDKILDELHPSQRAGMSIDGEDVETKSTSSPTTSQLISHMGKDEAGGHVGRVPAVKFVAEDDPSEFWSLGDERVVAGADVTYTKETYNAMLSGRICMRCQEPQDEDFPVECDLCGYSMKELQIRDLALEFKGEKHLGPSQPVSEFMDQAEEEYLKRKFAQKIAEGKSPMKGLKNRAQA